MNLTPHEHAALRTRRPAQRREREVQAAILKFLQTCGGVSAWRVNVCAVKARNTFVRFGFRGLPDIIGWTTMCMAPYCERGVKTCRTKEHLLAWFFCVEVKSDVGKLTPAQEAFRQHAE